MHLAIVPIYSEPIQLRRGDFEISRSSGAQEHFIMVWADESCDEAELEESIPEVRE